MIWKGARIGEQLQPAFAALRVGHRYFDPRVIHALREFRGSSDGVLQKYCRIENCLCCRYWETAAVIAKSRK